MPESTIVKTKRDGTITFSDLGGANTYTVSYEAGDFSLTIPGTTVNNFLDRGRITAPPAIRYGDDQALTGSFSGYLRDAADATYATLTEILTQSGEVGASWTSTMGANGEVFTLKIVWTISGLIHGDPSDHVLEFDYCYVTGSLTEGDPNVVNIDFTSFVTLPTVT